MHNPLSRRAFASLAFAIAATAAHAQADYPSRPITVIVPFAAGGSSDIIARLVAQNMSATLRQQIIIENAAGAGGTAGAARLAKAAPDGYTLLVHHLAIASSASLYARLPYDAANAFQPLGLINSGPYVIMARLGFEASNVGELLDKLRRDGAKVTMAHSGVGAGSHLCATFLGQALNAPITQVAYRGAAQSAQDILAGNVDLLCEQTATALPHIETKKAKAFAVTSTTRVAQLPDLPTLDEAGIKGFDLTNWHGLYAPRNTPGPIVAKLDDALRKALADPLVVQRFRELGTELFPEEQRGPEAHARMFASEIVRWAEVVKKAGIEPQ